MGLKSLEIQGFKSFKDKITLDFHHTITAIVGPNGSGKSNISDAILWVLGEQSAKTLRGTKMQDVIFAGTDRIKPVNVCQVSMTFVKDEYLNIPYQEVTISRRVYRTGESEYYLNKAQVRLRDIREFFLDTGIGKEGYSVIGQGKIDQILSAKNDEIRNIFEEAAQIAKSKYKKEESIRRLKKTNENLARVEDILIPQRERLSFLKKEKEKAEQGVRLQNEIREASLHLARERIDKSKQQQEAVREKKRILMQDLSDDMAQMEALKESFAPKTEKIEQLTKQCETSRLEYEKLQKQQEKISYDIRLNLEKEKFNQREIDRYTKEIAEQEHVLKMMQEKSNAVFQEIEEKKLILEQTVQKFRDYKNQTIEKERQKTSLEKVLKTQTDELQELEAHINRLTVEKMTRSELLKTGIQQKKSFQQELVQLQERKRNVLKKLEGQEQILEDITKKIQYYRQELSDCLANLAQNEKERQLLQKEMIVSDSKIQENTSKLNFYKGSFENREGFFYAVQKFFKVLSSEQKSKAYAFADLMTVQDGYEKVVETLLQSTLQNIVVETKAEAKEFIALLKQKKIGRLTFLPLDSIRPRASETVSHADIIGKASEFVHTTPRIKPLVEYFLNQTLIVSSVDEALRVSKKYPRFRIATLDGDIINTWGSMVGGYKKENKESNLLNRQKILQDLQENIRRLTESRCQVEQKMNQLQIKFTEWNNKKIDLESMIESFDLKEKEAKAERQQWQTNLSYFDRDMLRVEESIQKLQISNAIEEIESLEELEERRDTLRKSTDKLSFDQLSKELTQRQMQEIQMQNEVDTLQRDLRLLENTRLDIDEKEQNIKDRVKNLQKIFDDQSNEILQLTRSTDRNRKHLEKTEQQLVIVRGKIPISESQLKQLEMESESTRYEISELTKNIEINRYKIENLEKELLKLLEEEQEICDTIQEEFQVTMDQISPMKKKVSQKMLNGWKENLRQIGPYSIDAIEEFFHVDENVTFLERQKKDLVQSREDVTKIIQELDKEMRAEFRKSFEEINHKFNEIFKILFEGGRAELVLKGEDILLCDIEIIAKPPGKKLQSLSLLSGGERSLTAICLLFAIFETKPSSFCLLDEIDAALDELNVNRFKKYLIRFSEKTQFLIITHRKSTMEIADVLYGVSMEEHGVSKVIECDLGE